MRMACRVIKKILGYEICVLDKEGTLFYEALQVTTNEVMACNASFYL